MSLSAATISKNVGASPVDPTVTKDMVLSLYLEEAGQTMSRTVIKTIDDHHNSIVTLNDIGYYYIYLTIEMLFKRIGKRIFLENTIYGKALKIGKFEWMSVITGYNPNS